MNETIRKAIDMDQWKHSWHNKLENEADVRKAKGVITEKIGQRQEELRELFSALMECDRMIDRFVTLKEQGID